MKQLERVLPLPAVPEIELIMSRVVEHAARAAHGRVPAERDTLYHPVSRPPAGEPRPDAEESTSRELAVAGHLEAGLVPLAEGGCKYCTRKRRPYGWDPVKSKNR